MFKERGEESAFHQEIKRLMWFHCNVFKPQVLRSRCGTSTRYVHGKGQRRFRMKKMRILETVRLSISITVP